MPTPDRRFRRRSSWGREPVRVDLPRWQPAHRLDQLNAIRSELEEEGIGLPMAAEYDDGSR